MSLICTMAAGAEWDMRLSGRDTSANSEDTSGKRAVFRSGHEWVLLCFRGSSSRASLRNTLSENLSYSTSLDIFLITTT